jgi:hypothetical protein
MASATSTAVFAVVAKDAASGVMRGIGKQMGSLGKTGGAVFKSIAVGAAAAAAAITAAFGLAAKFAKTAIQAAIEDDAEQQKLIATLKARGQTTEQATQRVNELIEAGAKLAFTDSEIRAGYEVATRFAKSYANQQKILTTAQDLARSSNISLEAATKIVGKAFDGNGRALKNYGITLEEGVRGTEALGQINQKVGGVAEEFAKTFAGQFKGVRDAINETVESIGYAIGGGEGLPTFTRLLEGIRPVLDDVLGGVKANLPNIQRFTRELVEKFLAKLPGYVATAKRELPILIDKATKFIGSVAGFGKDIATFLGPDGLVTAGIAGIGFKMGGLGGAAGAVFASEFIKLGIDPITATITGTIAGALSAGVVQGLGSALAQAAITKFLGLFKSIPVTPSIPATIPGGVPGAAGTAATSVGTAAVAGVVAVAGAAAAAAAIVGIAAIAYSSIVPKDVQAAISRRLGDFGRTQGERGEATGAGGTYNAGGTYQGGTSSYLNLNSTTTIKLDGAVVAQSVSKHLGLTTTLNNGTRNGGR